MQLGPLSIVCVLTYSDVLSLGCLPTLTVIGLHGTRIKRVVLAILYELPLAPITRDIILDMSRDERELDQIYRPDVALMGDWIGHLVILQPTLDLFQFSIDSVFDRD